MMRVWQCEVPSSNYKRPGKDCRFQVMNWTNQPPRSFRQKPLKTKRNRFQTARSVFQQLLDLGTERFDLLRVITDFDLADLARFINDDDVRDAGTAVGVKYFLADERDRPVHL